MSRVIKQHGPEQFAAFASSSSTLEELYLLQKFMRGLGVNNLDHRLQQTDFIDQDNKTVMPTSSLPYAELEHQNTVLLFGCNVDREVPLAGVRVRKAFTNGGEIYAINPVDYSFHFDLMGKIIVSPQEMPLHLANLVLSLVDDTSGLPAELQKLLIGLNPDSTSKAIALALCQPNSAIVTGALCENHPQAALLRTLLYWLEKLSGARVLGLTTGANSAGANLAGMLPHRAAAGKVAEPAGMDVHTALDAKLKGYFLMGVEPGFDFANPHCARQSMLAAEFVVVLSGWQDESIQDYANVILPMGPYAETSGTYINVDKLWQTVKGALVPPGEARPCWKILRVLANMLHVDGFEYASTDDVLSEIKTQVSMMHDNGYKPFYPECLPVIRDDLVRVGEWPLYRVDATVRHAVELQHCGSAEAACIRVHPETARRLQLDEYATVSQGDIEITLPLKRDERIAPDVIWVANAMPETVDLGHAFGAITVKQ